MIYVTSAPPPRRAGTRPGSRHRRGEDAPVPPGSGGYRIERGQAIRNGGARVRAPGNTGEATNASFRKATAAPRREGNGEQRQAGVFGERRAVEQQAAITALLPEHVAGQAIAFLAAHPRHAGMDDGALGIGTAGMGHVAMVHVLVGHAFVAHPHAHRHRVVHRHRLGDQRPDEDHQHGEQSQPCTDALSFQSGRHLRLPPS